MKNSFIVISLGIAALAPVLSLTCHAQLVTSQKSDDSAQRQVWRKSMKQTHLPKKGCFTVSYPDTAWHESTCTTAPNIPLVPKRGTGAQTVGNSTDFVAGVTSGLISTADGFFANSSGVTSESGYVNNVPPAYANSFTLQLNSNYFTDPPACSGASNPSVCQGWQQFVVAEGDGGSATLFMQYWLLDYGTTCPGGWTAYEIDCYKNSSATALPAYPASSIPGMELTGEAESGTDTAQFTSAAPAEILYAVGADSVLALEQHWTQAEFNVFGDAGAGEANFNGDSTFIVQTSVNNGTTNLAQCLGPQGAGTTGETNNLTLIPASSPVCCPMSGAIQFMESNASGVGASCGTGGLQVTGNYAATPTSADGSITTITHPIIEGEIRTQYSVKLEDTTPGATIDYQLFNSCGQSLGTGSVASGSTIFYLNTEIEGQTCTYGSVRGTMYATASGYLPSLTSTIVF